MFGGLLSVSTAQGPVAAARCAGTGTVEGVVSDATGDSLGGVEVRLIAASSANPSSQTFDLSQIDFEANLMGSPLPEEAVTFLVNAIETGTSYSDITDDDGIYQMCITPAALGALATLASFTFGEGEGSGFQPDDIGVKVMAVAPWDGVTDPEIGTSQSETVDMGDCSLPNPFVSCVNVPETTPVDVELGSPTIWGVNTDSDEVLVMEEFDRPFTSIPVDSNGRFVAAIDLTEFVGSRITIFGYSGADDEFTFGRTLEVDDSGILGLIEPGNLTGTVLAPDGSDLDMESGLQAWMAVVEDGQPTDQLRDFVFLGRNPFFANLTPGFVYRVNAEANGFTPAIGHVKLAEDGSLVETDELGTIVDDSDDLVVTGNSIEIRVGEPSIRFRTYDLAGEVVTDASAVLFRWNGESFCCDPQNVSPADDGSLGVALEENGRYGLSFSPPFDPANDAPLLATGGILFEFDAETSTLSECATWDGLYGGSGPADCQTVLEVDDDGYYRFDFVEPDIVFDARHIDDSAAATAYTRVDKEGQFGFGGNTIFASSTNINGLVGLEFSSTTTAGRYQVTVEPPYPNSEFGRDDLVESESTVEFCLVEDGQSVSLDEDCDDVGDADSTILVELRSPNFSGTVYEEPFENEDDANTSRAFIRVQESYEGDRGDTRWRDVDWVNVEPDGVFASFLVPTDPLDPRPYRILVEPPSRSERAQSIAYVLVTEDGSCVVEDDADSTCAGALQSEPPFEFFLTDPNLTGEVRAGEGTVSASVRAFLWNGQWFDWVDKQVETGLSGRFSFGLEPGFWKIEAEPRGADGFADGVAYIWVLDDGTGWCEIVLDDFGFPDENCVGDIIDDDDLVLSLPGANFNGRVLRESENGSGVRDAYVEVSIRNNFGPWEWLGSTGTGRNGSFSLRLELPPGSDWTEVTVSVNPPYGDSTLARREFTYYVGDDGDLDLVADDICRGEVITMIDGTVYCDQENRVDPLVDETLVLTGGNVTGVVFESDGTTRATNIGVEVQKVVVYDWGTNYEWLGLWSNSNEDGEFSFNVIGDSSRDDDRYRATARPWGRQDVSPTSVEFCLVDGELDADCDGEASDGERVEITLNPPNVTGIVTTDTGTPVARSWLGVERKFYYSFDNGTPLDLGDDQEWSWWQFTGAGAETNAVGEFAISAEVPSEGDEEYRLRVEPPWYWTEDTPLVRFTSPEFQFGEGIESIDFSGPDTLQFPAPKLQLTIQDPNAEIVVGAGVTVLKLRTVGDWSYWEWTDVYGWTNRDGKVSLNPADLTVPEGDPDVWKVVVDPPWWSNDQNLPRFEVELDQAIASNDVGVVGGAYVGSLEFPESNVSGTAVLDDDTPNDWGWISAERVTSNDNGTPGDASDDFSNFEWVASSNTDREGTFSMRLGEVGEYLVRVWANWSNPQPPLDVIVTIEDVEGDLTMTAWRYRTDTGGTNRCDDPCRLDVNFDDVPTNFQLIVRDGSRPDPADRPLNDGVIWLKISAPNGWNTTVTDEDTAILRATLPTGSDTYTFRVAYYDKAADTMSCWTLDWPITVTEGIVSELQWDITAVGGACGG